MTPRRKRLLIVVAAVVAVVGVACGLAYHRIQYQRQFVGHWGWPPEESLSPLTRERLKRTEGWTLFADGTGFERMPPRRIRWWATGNRLCIQHPGANEWNDFLSRCRLIFAGEWEGDPAGIERITLLEKSDGTFLLDDTKVKLPFEVLPEDRQMDVEMAREFEAIQRIMKARRVHP